MLSHTKMTATPLEVLVPQVTPKALSSILVRWQLKFHQGMGRMWDSSRSVQSHKYFFLVPSDLELIDLLPKLDSWGMESHGRKPSCLHNSPFPYGIITRSKLTSPVEDQPQSCGNSLLAQYNWNTACSITHQWENNHAHEAWPIAIHPIDQIMSPPNASKACNSPCI